MILVTGAAGKTGRAVLWALAQRGAQVRALVHRSEQGQVVQSLGVEELVVGDLRDDPLLTQALEGVSAIYHIPPNVHPDEFAIGSGLISAALASGVERFVYHSVLHPAIEAMPHHWEKMRVEELLVTSGLDFTILQPAAYMQNLFAQWDSFVEQGRYTVPYPVETRLSLVDVEDLGAAAALVLTEADHSGASYQIVGTRPVTQLDVAETLSEVFGRLVQAEAIPTEEWQARAQSAGLGEYPIQTLLKMFAYYAAHDFIGSPRVLRWLLGRPPTSLKTAVEREYQRRCG